ncbi:hypothetical protein ACFVH7_20070 [Kitasatospora indigofera]|uniref:hypothetical protein n=1 Tax=Kitasatospora indigofera TaxID=67307 RepID=UPI00363C7F13
MSEDDLEFAPYLQSSIGAAIRSSTPNLPPDLAPTLQLSGPRGQRLPVQGTGLRMLGPEGVVGLDTRHITRVEPAPGSTEVEPNYLPCVEFDSPELPWLFTPARAADGRLRPWLLLIVVEAAGHAVQPGNPLPFVDVELALLPPLGDSWQWAHLQRPAGQRGPLISRLLCPRRLGPDTDYLACLVPAFQAGVTAGLSGGFTDVDQLGDAWPFPGQDVFRLPVYHHWGFRTGAEGDFEELATAVVPLGAAEAGPLGGRTVDITRPWLHGPPLDSGDPAGGRQTITVQGVLTLFAPPPGTATAAALENFRSRVAEHIGRGTETALAPPLYGGHPVAAAAVEPSAAGWLADLNLDPENRIAAALGADWVRQNQEFLMARAWEQVGAVREANRKRQEAAFCTRIAGSLHRRHLQTLTPAEIVEVAAPVGDRVRTDSGLPLRTELAVSPAPTALAGTALHRLLRRSGPVARRAALDGDSFARRTLSGALLPPLAVPLVTRPTVSPAVRGMDSDPLAARVDGALRSADTRRATGLLRTMSALAPAALANGFTAQAEAITAVLAPSVGQLAGAPQGFAGGAPDPAGLLAAEQLFDAPAVAPLVPGLAAALAAPPEGFGMTLPEPDTALTGSDGMGDDPGTLLLQYGVPVDPDGIKERLARALDPGPLLAARLADRVTLAGEPLVALPEQVADPVMACPDFPAAMALALKESEPDWFLPGSAAVPDDRAVLLKANGPFIAAFMVGANDELNREMRWREYPTDLRGSPFTHFWPRPDGLADIPPVHGWAPDGALGSHLALDADGLDVLLIRGRLVRRYPGLVVAAVPPAAVRRPDLDPDHWLAPVMVLPMDERTCAYAFQLPPGEQILDWWIVLAENGRRLRFGYDTAPGTGDGMQTWDDLNWERVQAGGFASLGAMPRPEPVEEREHPRVNGRPWNAADVARVTLQRPFRLLRSARSLIGEHP